MKKMLSYIQNYKANELKKRNLTVEEAEAKEIKIIVPGAKRCLCIRKKVPNESLLMSRINKLELKINNDKAKSD
jgi:hypothetical protein